MKKRHLTHEELTAVLEAVENKLSGAADYWEEVKGNTLEEIVYSAQDALIDSWNDKDCPTCKGSLRRVVGLFDTLLDSERLSELPSD